MERNFIMRQFGAISTVLLLSVFCCAGSEKTGRFMNISSNIPKSMMAEIPSWGLDHPQILSDPNDPNQTIRKREIDYTWTWLEKTINIDILSDVNKGNFQFLSNLGKKKDDALMISWSKDQFDITVVDGRFLALSVRLKNEVQADVETVFRKVIRYSYHANKDRVKINFETLSATDSNETWGRIIVDRDNATGWYEKPIDWYRKGDYIIFAFEKAMKPPNGKGSVTRDDIIIQLIGGIPIDDSRSFSRYEKSNRDELSKEYFQKRKRESNVKKVDDKEMQEKTFGPLA
jgi:hypothetical protein